MEFELTDLGAATQVTLRGRLDAPGAGRIEQRLLEAIAASGKNTLVDLAGVSFISSLGIRLLLSAADALRPRQAVLVLHGAQPLVAESLNLVVKQLIPVASDASQALALLAARDADRR